MSGSRQGMRNETPGVGTFWSSTATGLEFPNCSCLRGEQPYPPRKARSIADLNTSSGCAPTRIRPLMKNVGVPRTP